MLYAIYSIFYMIELLSWASFVANKAASIIPPARTGRYLGCGRQGKVACGDNQMTKQCSYPRLGSFPLGVVENLRGTAPAYYEYTGRNHDRIIVGVVIWLGKV